MPRLAAFPKAFMQALCKDGTMTVTEWIDLAVKLDIDGLEWYAGFLEMSDKSNWSKFRKRVKTMGRQSHDAVRRTLLIQTKVLEPKK